MTPPSAPPLRLAVVGTGHLGRHHARIASKAPGIVCVGVHDHHPGRAAEVAGPLGLETLPDLAAVAERAEAAIVATTTVSHGEVAGELLERGLHVLVEKPITATLEEADRLLALSRARGKVLAVGHVERHNPAVEAGMSILRQPVFAEVHRLAPFTPRSLDVDVVLDLMIHDIQIVRAIAGRPVEEIRASGVPVLTPRIDIANARLAFGGGFVANLTASRVSAERMRKLRVFASDLYVSVDMQARTAAGFRVAHDGGAPRIVPVPVTVEPGDPLERQLADFAGAIRTGAAPRVSGEEGREALAIALQVLEAIEAHRRQVEEGA
jgi:predicted dehydrogenase